MRKVLNCYYPTKVVFLDDNLDFLDGLKDVLDFTQASYAFFSHPEDALRAINEEYKPDSLVKRHVQSYPSMEEAEHGILDVNLNELYKEAYNPKRFEQISTLVVDYDMPAMDGLEVCRQIKHPNIQKILLTGVADEKMAVGAFNDGIINQFIRKQESNVLDTINAVVAKAQQNYFLDVLSIIRQSVRNNPEGLPTAIFDPAFVKMFHGLLTKYKIAEYYQFERVGSYLLLDADGNDRGLFTLNTDRIQADYDEICEEEDMDPKFVEEVKNKKRIFCYHEENMERLPPVRKWPQYFMPAKELRGKEQFYCACEPKLVKFDRKRFLSFNTYRKPFSPK